MTNVNAHTVIDGSTLSLLLYAHLNGNGNQMGFLLGHRLEDIQDRISDSQIHAEDTKSYIYISSFVPWPSLRYGHADQINLEDIKKAHEGFSEEVIGWYSFRHQSSLRPSLKEATIHRQLMAKEDFEESRDFLFFLCTSSATTNMSTHSSDHAFMRYDSSKRRFKNISTNIRNLGDTSRSDYLKPSMTFTLHSQQTRCVVDKSIENFVRPTGEMDQVVKMKQFAESIGKSLDSLQVQVTKSEASLGPLEDEVRYLRKRLAHLETKDMTHIFASEQQQRLKEEEDNMTKEVATEPNEQEQMNKLLTDLGLSTDIASTLFQKPEERSRKLSQDHNSLISWEKLEVNPLYASTLNDNQAASFNPAQTLTGTAASESMKSNTEDRSCSNKTHVAKDSGTGATAKKNIITPKDKEEKSNSSNSKQPSKDPFAFVEQMKSELNGCKLSNSKIQSKTSVKSSAIQPHHSSDSESDQKEHGQHGNEHQNHTTESSADDLNLSSSPKSNNSQLRVDETLNTLSSSPVF